MNINKLSERGPHTHLQRYIRQKVQRFVKANEKKRKKRNIFFSTGVICMGVKPPRHD